MIQVGSTRFDPRCNVPPRPFMGAPHFIAIGCAQGHQGIGHHCPTQFADRTLIYRTLPRVQYSILLRTSRGAPYRGTHALRSATGMSAPSGSSHASLLAHLSTPIHCSLLSRVNRRRQASGETRTVYPEHKKPTNRRTIKSPAQRPDCLVIKRLGLS